MRGHPIPKKLTPRVPAEADARKSEHRPIVTSAGTRWRAVGVDRSDEMQAPEFSDDALAEEFIHQATCFRWTPGMGWMVDSGVVWERDEHLRRFQLARQVCRAAAVRRQEPEPANRIASARTRNAVLSLAQADPRIVVPSGDWDRNGFELNTPDGVVCLKTGSIRPRRRSEYVTQATRASPAASPSPVWDRFMLDICCGDQDLLQFLQRSLGYCLTGDRREQVLFFWHGLGSNGKSALAETVQWLMGTYSLKLPANALMHSRNDRHPTELAQLRGKRLVVSSELEETSSFNEALVKELTGDQTLAARFMRGDFFEFDMTQKHVIIGNHRPTLRGGDAAMARRMLLVPFEATIKGDARDPNMLQKLKGEGPAILNWLIRGAVVWGSEGLGVPAVVRNASADYMADHDDLTLWLAECCVREGESKSGALFESFGAWKRARGEQVPTQTTWGTRLTAMPGIKKRKSGGVVYSGVSLIPPCHR